MKFQVTFPEENFVLAPKELVDRVTSLKTKVAEQVLIGRSSSQFELRDTTIFVEGSPEDIKEIIAALLPIAMFPAQL